MKKSLFLLSCIALSFSSLAIHVKADSSESERVIVKKYYVGKPGYNRRLVKVYKNDLVNDINYLVVSNAPAAGLLGTQKSERPQASVRQHVMKF